MGYQKLLQTLRLRIGSKEFYHKQISTADRVAEVSAKGIDIDTASPLFIAGLHTEAGEHDLRGAQAMDAIKCQLTDPKTGKAITGPDGARMIVNVSTRHQPCLQ